MLGCLDHHSPCASSVRSAGDRPGRLIHVGRTDNFSDVRLCSDFEANERYMNLSHCWGPNGVRVKLLECNLQQYSAQLPWTDLPRTFKDAIVVVRNLSDLLGVVHLWIDALCIIQDSDTYKQRELAHMGKIYRFSLCNLAACSGGDSNCGLVQESDPSQIHECVVETGYASQLGSRVRIENHD